MIEGLLKWAGIDGRYWKATIIKDDGTEWKRDIPEVGVQTKAVQFIGKRVKATETKNANNQYMHISDIQLIAPEGAKVEQEQVAKKYNSRFTEDQVGLQKCRCSLIDSACTLFAGNKTVTVDHITAAAKAFEKYVYEPTLADTAQKMAEEEMPF